MDNEKLKVGVRKESLKAQFTLSIMLKSSKNIWILKSSNMNNKHE